MNQDEVILSERAAALRQEFDESFAKALTGATTPTRAFLAIGVGGDNYAFNMGEVSGVFVDKKVVPLPSESSDLLGITSFRGTLVPVYDLRILLGYPAAQSLRWLVLVSSETPVALAFDRLDGYLDVPLGAVVPPSGTVNTRQYITETLSADGAIRPIVSVASILKTLKQRAQSSTTHEKS